MFVLVGDIAECGSEMEVDSEKKFELGFHCRQLLHGICAGHSRVPEYGQS